MGNIRLSYAEYFYICDFISPRGQWWNKPFQQAVLDWDALRAGKTYGEQTLCVDYLSLYRSELARLRTARGG